MEVKLPRLIVNLKNYEQGSSREALDLLGVFAEKVKGYSFAVGVAVNQIDLKDCLRFASGNLQIFAQHIDAVGYGASTGKVNLEYLDEIGVYGGLVNHSEDRVGLYTIQKNIEALDKYEMTSVVCAESLEEAIVLADMYPDIVAYEPAELIGGDVSVISKKEVVIDLLGKIEVPVMIGAGIKTTDDVEQALKLGCYGVLVASGIVKNERPGEILEKFLKVIQSNV